MSDHRTLPQYLRGLVLLAALASSACASLSTSEQQRATAIAVEARSTEDSCGQADACARPSPLRALGERALSESGPDKPRHYALLLDYGQDALIARLDLFRSATRSIDIQTYIFDEDDAGRLTLEELLAAAKRGVKVRVLIDQLSALKEVDTLAALAGAHVNLEFRVYNPMLDRARISYPQYVLAAACCWRRLNQRMHSKMLVVDERIAVTGGRNYQDDYFDWSAEYNFRDRDVLVAGPEVEAMQDNFDAFWRSRLAVPVERLADVGGHLLEQGVPDFGAPDYADPERVAAVIREADDASLVESRLAAMAMPVGEVEFLADLPEKHREGGAQAPTSSTRGLRELIEGAENEVILQTPYLVLSGAAQDMFRDLQERENAPRVLVSTNSLAATDSFITYAMSFKYKRRYLRDFGFEIHEYKPFPQDAPIDVDATGAVDIAWDESGQPIAVGENLQSPQPLGNDPNGGPRPLTREYSALRFAGINVNDRVPLERAGVRIGLHAKSLVIDDRIGVVGTHNFDPRGDSYNTESAVVVHDPAFAQRLAASIRRDMAPSNSWTIARRDKPPIFSGLEYSLAKVSEHLPIFDLWPVRYATSYEFQPGPECPVPLPIDNPRFRQCYEPVGDFPEVAMSFKSLMTRIFTAFGGGLAPIL